MTEGTSTRSAEQIDRAVEALGSSLSSGAGWDGSRVGITVRTSELDPALGIIADVARNATLADEEIERQRTTAIDGVAVSMRDPGDVSGLAAMRALYGASPYGHPGSGTATTLRAITRQDIQTAYRQTWVPQHATLILSGDISPARARALAQRHFGDWHVNLPPIDRSHPAVPAPHGQIIVIDMPGAGQAAVAVARNTIARRDPHYYRALVANAVLGGGYSARLNQEIRIRRGLSYGAGSGIEARREPGPFVASVQTRNDAAAQVLGLILAEMRRLGTEPIPAAELAARRASLTGDFGRDMETTAGVAGLIATYVMRGINPDEVGRYLPGVLAVTPAEAQGAAAELLSPENTTVVIVGEAARFIDQLRRDHPDVTVIPLTDLNLDSATLRAASAN
jgi:zinc protease